MTPIHECNGLMDHEKHGSVPSVPSGDLALEKWRLEMETRLGTSKAVAGFLAWKCFKVAASRLPVRQFVPKNLR